MNKAKIKDRILADIKGFKPLNEIEGLDKHLLELEREGYVKTRYNEQHKPIFLRITPQGEDFLKQGGYVAMEMKNKRGNLKRFLTSFTGRVVEAVLIAILTLVTSWWVTNHYGLSDNPQCEEHMAVKNDSTFSSRPSSSGLKADSVASLGKSADTCRDSSRSTVDKHSIGTPANETSAQHSSVRDESKPTPSGK